MVYNVRANSSYLHGPSSYISLDSKDHVTPAPLAVQVRIVYKALPLRARSKPAIGRTGWACTVQLRLG